MNVIGGVSILQELILALGGALLVGNLAVVIRERSRKRSPERSAGNGSEPSRGPAGSPNMKLVALNLVVGAVLVLWAVASIAVSR